MDNETNGRIPRLGASSATEKRKELAKERRMKGWRGLKPMKGRIRRNKLGREGGLSEKQLEKRGGTRIARTGSGGKGHGRAQRTQGPFCPGRRRKQDWISYKGQAIIRQGGLLEVSGSWPAASSVIQDSSRAGILYILRSMPAQVADTLLPALGHAHHAGTSNSRQAALFWRR